MKSRGKIVILDNVIFFYEMNKSEYYLLAIN